MTHNPSKKFANDGGYDGGTMWVSFHLHWFAFGFNGGGEQLKRAFGLTADGTGEDLQLQRRSVDEQKEMGGVRVERTQYRRWGGGGN